MNLFSSQKKDNDIPEPLEDLFELEEELVDKLPLNKSMKVRVLMILDLLINVLIIVVLVFITRTFFISPFQVFGPSMCNTLNYINEQCHHGFGEYIIVNKAGYQNFFGIIDGEPDRGDIIVFHPPKNDKDFFIKRIIGLPGETVEISDNKVFIINDSFPDGVQIEEDYLTEDNRNATNVFWRGDDLKRTFKVPEKQYFVMGDNRRESTDSRTCFIAPYSARCGEKEHFLAEERIEGKAWVVLWPFGDIRFLSQPKYITLSR
jgi:signal peptidase I